MIRYSFLLPALAVAGLVVACGGGDGGAPPTTATAEPSASPTAEPTPQITLVAPSFTPAATPVLSTDLATASPLLTILAADPVDLRTGISSLARGDFNGDGIADLLIGMPFADGLDNAREDAGEAFVIFGRGDLSAEIDLADEAADLHILGALPGDNLGFGVAGGDLNDDGVDDIIVGATASNGLTNIRTDLGEVYVIFGRGSLGGTIDTAEEDQDFTFIAAEGFARLGTSFAVADVNGDGIVDLVGGAPFAGREAGTPPGGPRTTVGEVYVVFGSPGLEGRASVAEDEQDFALAGVKEMDAFGHSVTAGDVNGDGIADIVVGARGFDGADGTREDAGAVFVFFGASDLSGKLAIDDADFTLLGADEGDALGEAITSGDFNGDGLADIVAVARTGDGPDNGRENGGEAHVVLGAASLSGTLDLASQAADAVVYGVDRSSLMATVAVAGDLDGDGRDDLVLGTPLASTSGRRMNGVTYVTFGDGLMGTVDLFRDVERSLFMFGAEDEDALGTGAVTLDINGDGELELALAAAGPPDAQGPRGKVYAIELP